MIEVKEKTLFFIVIIILSIVSFFIYANIIEKVAYIDLPQIRSVGKTNNPKLIFENNYEGTNIDRYGFFGVPTLLRYGRYDYALSLDITDPDEDGYWKLSNSVAGLHVYGKGDSGRLGNSVIFALDNSMVLDFVYLAAEGDKISLDTNLGWSYIYRVKSKSVINKNSKYITSESQKNKLIIVRSTENDKAIVVEAEFLNVEDKSI